MTSFLYGMWFGLALAWLCIEIAQLIKGEDK